MPNYESAIYPPINTLKRVADNIWIVDGPVIRFGMPWLKFPFPTRMTVVQLNSGELFLHSPTPATPSLRTEIAREGVNSHPTPTPLSRPKMTPYRRANVPSEGAETGGAEPALAEQSRSWRAASGGLGD